MRLNLVDSKSDRNFAMTKANEGKVNLVEMLKKYGEVVDYMTEPMVANFYGVNQKGVEQVANRNGKELEKYGYRVYKRSEILNLQVVGLENIPNRGLRLYPIKSVIVIGMMLTESEVAERLRSDIIDILFNDKETKLTRKEELQLAILNGDDLEKIYALQDYKTLVVDEATKPLIETIETQKPKVNYHDKVLNGDKLVTTTDIAKDLGMTARELHNKLHDMKIIFKTGNHWTFYAKYQTRIPLYADYQIGEHGQILKWTERGRKWIIKLLNEQKEKDEKALQNVTD